jgi:uncharacterized membrane protein
MGFRNCNLLAKKINSAQMGKMSPTKKTAIAQRGIKNRFFLILAGIFAIGAGLRLYLFASQIFLDDEWISVNQVIGKTYADVITQFNPVDNSSLLFNLYNLALYRSLGWSEWTLRLPVMLAGLLSLIILPLMTKRIFGERVSIIFAGFLAISPFLIFYSRYARGYEIATMSGFMALLLFHVWQTTGKDRYATGFVLTGAIAIYAHLFSLIAVFVPLVTAFGCGVVNRFKRAPSASGQNAVSLVDILFVSFVLMALLLPLLWPVISQAGHLPWRDGSITKNGVATAANLIAGTGNLPMTLLFFLLFAAGWLLLFRRNQLLGWTLLSTTCAYAIVLLTSRPPGMQRGEVLLRYLIVMVPLALMLVALAMECLLKLAAEKGVSRSVQAIGLALIFVIIFAAGPLPALYHRPNNFTNHSAFQGAYKTHAWNISEANTVFPAFAVATNQIPAFYYWLQKQEDIGTIIEYPFDVCDYNDLFYYYQHFHQKNIIAGYCSDRKLLGYKFPTVSADESFTIGIFGADQMLSRVADQTKLAFRNMVDVTSPDAILRSKAGILILHKYIMAPKFTSDASGKGLMRDEITGLSYEIIPVYYNSTAILKTRIEKEFGLPVYEDDQVVCFRIKPEKSG